MPYHGVGQSSYLSVTGDNHRLIPSRIGTTTLDVDSNYKVLPEGPDTTKCKMLQSTVARNGPTEPSDRQEAPPHSLLEPTPSSDRLNIHTRNLGKSLAPSSVVRNLTPIGTQMNSKTRSVISGNHSEIGQRRKNILMAR